MKIVIIGAGIAGSTLALALDRFGIEYQLIEQASEFSEVGAGIQLSPNGVRILEALGLGASLNAFSTEPDFHKYSVWDTGETVLKTPLKPLVREAYGHAYYHAHRADLIAALTERLNADSVRMNTRVVSIDQSDNGVRVTLEGGEILDADLVVGADTRHANQGH